MTPKRILFLDCSLTHGGAQRSLYSLMMHLDRERYEPHLLCGNDALYGLLKQCRKKGINSGFLTIRTWRRTLTGIHQAVIDLLKAKPMLNRWIEKNKIDLLYANGLQAALVCALTAPDDIPVIYHNRDYRCPKRAMRKVLDRAQRTIMISDFVKNHWSELLPQFEDKMVRVYNGFDFKLMDNLRTQHNYRFESRMSKETFVVSYLADLVTWKRHDLFIDAFQKIHQNEGDSFAFIIGGPRDKAGEKLESELLKKVEDYDLLEAMAFTDHILNPFPLLNTSDLVVSTAENEPFGRNIVEALFCGKPVICTGGGPAEIGAGCPAVEVVEPTVDAVAEAALNWHSKPTKELESLSEAANVRARAFCISTHIQQISAEIDACLKQA